MGPGMPATPQEWERAAIIQTELESHLGAGNVTGKNLPCAGGLFRLAAPQRF